MRRLPADAEHVQVTFVAMDLITDAALVDTRVAAALGVRDRPGAPAGASITGTLTGRPTLLVLDGAEHVLAGVADLARRILAEVPEARIVITSRCVLGVSGEQVWPVPLLACPPPGAAVQAIAGSDAVRLFAARAAERLPGFEITAELAPPVAEVCRRLDGLPLAIELAAGWVGTLTISQILDRRLDLLDGAQPGDDRRVGTLRAVAESSTAMLYSRFPVSASRFIIWASPARPPGFCARPRRVRSGLETSTGCRTCGWPSRKRGSRPGRGRLAR